MLKKIFITIVVIFSLSLQIFAQYKPIAKEYSKQYRIEVEQLIDTEYYTTKQEIKNIALEASKMYQQVKKNPQDKDLYSSFSLNNYDIIIDSPEFNLYKKIINITSNYVDIKEKIPATDSSEDLYSFIYLYLKDNHIDTNRLKRIRKLKIKELKKIEQFYNKTHKYVNSN